MTYLPGWLKKNILKKAANRYKVMEKEILKLK